MLIIKGVGRQSGEVPVGQAQALEYFQGDMPAFLQKIDDVDKVKPLGKPNAYLMLHKPIGGLNIFTTLVAALEGEMTDHGILLKPLDFDHEKIQSPHMVIKGFIEGHLKTQPVAEDRTMVELDFTLTVELPLPAALKLVPRGLIQSTADGIMTIRLGAAVNQLYRKVLQDFNMPD